VAGTVLNNLPRTLDLLRMGAPPDPVYEAGSRDYAKDLRAHKRSERILRARLCGLFAIQKPVFVHG
jgi:hypothetical protein